MSSGYHTVHVRINDAAAGKPTPARVRFVRPDGEYLAPFGRLTEFATGSYEDVGGNLQLGSKKFAYIDGACEIRLPAEPVTVEVFKGYEYRPLRQQVTLGPGKLALRLTLERCADLRAEGWYSGDTRAHALSPHAALLEAGGEDLAVVNLLAAPYRHAGRGGKAGPAVSNILAFSGQHPALEQPGHLVVVNTHNTHPVLGSLGLLNSHRPVYPLTFGGPEGMDNWTLADWCDQCHRKGGLVVWTRLWPENRAFAWGEPLADLILGKVDAFEMDFFEDSPFDVLDDWYTLLKAGFRVPLCGASGKDCNQVRLGALRTYARLQPSEGLSYRGWIEAVRAGRTFVTNGPLLSLTVAGKEPGGVVDLGPNDGTVRVSARARSIVPFDQLELILNGAVVAHNAASGTPSAAALEADLPLTAGGWVACRCRGKELLPQRPAPQRVFAHTSPVYVNVGGQPPPFDLASVAELARQLDRMLEWVQQEGRFENEKQRRDLMEPFQNARSQLCGRGAATNSRPA